MTQEILIAEPRDILRAGLRSIFMEDARIGRVHEAANNDELRMQIRRHSLSLIIVNQLLLTDATLLPQGRFVILTSVLDIAVFQAAYKNGARGYLLENVSAELLRSTLCLAEGSVLVEPALIPYIMEQLCADSRFAIKNELLTPREREIISLLREGVSRPAIAAKLHISEATLKTHIKNIARKREQQNASNQRVS